MSTYGRSEIVWKYLIIYPKPRWPSALGLTENSVAGFISKHGGNVSQCHSDSIKESKCLSAKQLCSVKQKQSFATRDQFQRYAASAVSITEAIAIVSTMENLLLLSESVYF
ncbi:hypothetical protein T10_9042 [Trichinella papuae]|uniref:Uncharacterized protein n=1 Tax=Trichinella papuae TaxID=268474 RepID=A0A0V1M5R7_9BILA|nr:hypothetical protein T10_9042 [Trichinella papuae]